jgi:hypothetical protein
MADFHGGDRNRSGWQVNVNTLLAIAQLAALLVGGIWAFGELKGDVRVLDSRVSSLSHDVDQLRSYFGIPPLRSGTASAAP